MPRQTDDGSAVEGKSAEPVYIVNQAMPAPSASGVQVVRQETYSTVITGEFQGSTSADRLPDISAKWVKLKALASNAGNVYIGPSGVTKPNGTTDTSTGLELAPGDDSGWIPTDNLQRLYRICDNAGDDLTYMVLR